MSEGERNKAVIRRFYEEIDKGNLAILDELVDENYINHNPPPFMKLAPGREGLKQAFELFWTGTAGIHVIEDMMASGDKVITRLRGVGKHAGPLGPVPATGNDLDVPAIAIHRLKDGIIMEKWSVIDSATNLMQLGILKHPFPETASREWGDPEEKK